LAEWDSLAGDRWRSRKSDDELGTGLQTVLSFSGDVLNIFLLGRVSPTRRSPPRLALTRRYRPPTNNRIAKRKRIESALKIALRDADSLRLVDMNVDWIRAFAGREHRADTETERTELLQSVLPTCSQFARVVLR
jgi:hypothetical protein